MKKYCVLFLVSVVSLWAHGQAWTDFHEKSKEHPLEGLSYRVEMQTSASKNNTPLWLNANKYGLSSLDEVNGYLRASLSRSLSEDSTRRWAIGYGLDVVAPINYTSNVVVQQAYAEVRWLHGTLIVGSKQQPMEMKNNTLSSGSQTFGINSRPIPQVRLALADWWTLPFGRGWLHLKGHIAYGIMTDDSWQHDVTQRRTKYVDHALFHSKAGYLKIGNDAAFFPLSLEAGLEMGALFSGTSYRPDGKGGMIVAKGKRGLKAFLQALVPGGADPGEETYKNVSGDMLGSWVVRVNYDAERWRFSVYGDKFFEDHSAMFLLDYDGYGQGEAYAEKKDRKYFVYDLKDMMLGMEFNLKYGTWLRNIVFEYLYTKYQSGPLYHDHTPSISDHVGGLDNYYNHSIYTGWQHWGQVIGNPLYRSPIYNTDGVINVKNSRFTAFHLGVDGQPTERLGYRVLASWQDGLGTYEKPYTRKHHNVSFMAEATYALPRQWTVRGAYGMDFGHILGHNAGFQLTVAKSGLLGRKEKK